MTQDLAIFEQHKMRRHYDEKTETWFFLVVDIIQALTQQPDFQMQEIADPEKSLDRARDTWKQHGRSEKWVQQRMMGQETRNKLTNYWKDHEMKEGEEFAILTNIIHQEWADVSTQRKVLKNKADGNN